MKTKDILKTTLLSDIEDCKKDIELGFPMEMIEEEVKLIGNKAMRWAELALKDNEISKENYAFIIAKATLQPIELI